MVLPAYQPELTVSIPTVVGNVDYELWRNTLDRIDEILLDGRLEEKFVQLFVEQYRQKMEETAEARGRKPKRLLAEANIYNAICPRDPGVRNKRAAESGFRRLQKRRAQTEGRVGTLKNSFLGRPMPGKGFEPGQLNVAWAVLTHNLWVIARLPKADEAAPRLKSAA